LPYVEGEKRRCGHCRAIVPFPRCQGEPLALAREKRLSLDWAARAIFDEDEACDG
jgi:hypothetical protein